MTSCRTKPPLIGGFEFDDAALPEIDRFRLQAGCEIKPLTAEKFCRRVLNNGPA
jgi:hypothetical protein